ncbi:MAG TPA: SAM-dependent methyltransferase [Elusimicrobia bacterium]|nr:SAM-dependent methyltransferase [Elusimicrobiota bacterium]
MTDFTQRLAIAYSKRKQISANRYSLLNPATLYMAQGREKGVLRILKDKCAVNLSGKLILDVGCGSGGGLLDFVRYGANPKNLYGIDLLPERVKSAEQKLPYSNIYQGDAASGLPWPDSRFDIATQLTVFTSILEMDVKQALAKEIIRVLKPKGFLLWYDFHFDNPSNKDVKGVKKAEIEQLFPRCVVSLERITLAPPLSRLIAPYSTICCALLEKMKFLNTHYIGYIQKP